MIFESKNGGFFAYVECPKCGIDYGLGDDPTVEKALETETLLLKSPICSDCREEN